MIYTIEDVAKMLNVHPRTVRRYIDGGKLRGERVGGSWRISEEAMREMFDSPEMKDAFINSTRERSEDMLSLYLQGKHRLQKDMPAVMVVLVFDPQKEPWLLNTMGEWMAELNRLGESAQFDFTMTTSEAGLTRLTLIASPEVAQVMLGEWKDKAK
jgi:excisionase family DNA binding protein